MEQVLEFARAAAPWVAMGLLATIFAVRSAVGKKKDKKSGGDYGIEGMCLGMCMGIALGAANGNCIGIGISLGLFGLAIGMCIHKKRRMQSSETETGKSTFVSRRLRNECPI